MAISAAAVRTLVALISFSVNETAAIPDEKTYLAVAGGVATGRATTTVDPEYAEELYRSRWAFLVPLARVAEVFGPSRLPAQLFVVFFGLVAAVLTTIMARHVLSECHAVAAGLLTAFFPSQILWSSVVMVEALVWTALLLIAWCTLVAVRSHGRPLVLATIAICAGLLVLGSLRQQTLLAAAWALPIAVALMARDWRAGRLLGALTLAAVTPVFAGLGVGGWGLVRAAAPVLGQTRTVLSVDANSGFASVKEDKGDAVSPPVTGDRDDAVGALGIASRDVPREGGRGVVTDASGRRFVVDDSPAANLRHIPAGLAASLFRPVIFERGLAAVARLASIENLLWYGLYVLAAIGVWRCGGATRRLLAFPIVFSALLVGQFALTQGNVGTAFRHRGQLFWAVAVLACLGVQHLRPSASTSAAERQEAELGSGSPAPISNQVMPRPQR